MPPLSKKAFAKPTKRVCDTFKQPLLTQQNIENIIHTGENPKKQHSSNASFTTSTKKKEKFGRKLTKKNVSMHLSFEEGQTEEKSFNVSHGLMEPGGNDAYLKFVQSFSQSNKENSICSTPLTKEDSVLYKSSDDLFKSVDRSDPGLPAESYEMSQQVKVSLDSDVSLSQEYLNQKEVKNAYLECVDNLGLKKFDIIKNPTKSADISQQVKESLDSGVSLSQEYLNQKEVKNVYLEYIDNLELGKFGVTKNPTKKKPKCKSFDDSSKKKSKQPKKGSKALKENNSKDKSNCEKRNKEVNKKRKLFKDVSVVKTKHEEGKTKRKSRKEIPEMIPLENKDKEGERMSLYDKMILIQESRNVGLYALCDNCDKARYLPDIRDPLDLPDKWYCSMHPDEKHNKCSSPEEINENDIEFLIDNLYNAGSIVWARMDGYPWWPAMVEDDPDVEEYCWLEKDIKQPTWYHVTFFDSHEVTRAWLRPSHLKPFKINLTNPMFRTPKLNKFKSRIDASFKQAVDALGLPLIDRLRKYSFIQRYSKPWKLMNVTVTKEKQSQSKKISKKKDDALNKIKPKFRKIFSSNESLGKCDDNISDILNTMDWQNDSNFNINLLE